MRIISGEMNFNWYEFDMLDAIDEGNNDMNPGPIVYPNPIHNNQMFVKLGEHNQQDISIEIYSLTGKLVSKQADNSGSDIIKIDMSNISKGVFILSVFTVEKIFNYKIIRQ